MYCKNCGKETNGNQIICLSCGCATGTGNKYCANCGGEITPNAVACMHCGVASDFGVKKAEEPIKESPYSDKEWLTALLCCLFAGSLGIHRFYVGKVGTGIVWLLTLGCLGIGTLIDFIKIVCEKFTDKYGKILKQKK